MTCHCDDCKCQRCGTNVGHNSREYQYDHVTKTSTYVCEPCLVKAWPAPIQFIFHFGLPAWVEPTFRTKQWVRWLEQGFRHKRGTVHYVPRRVAEETWWLELWDRRDTPVEPYSYRGWCDYGRSEIVVLVDETETPESLQWITLHELGHLSCSAANFIDRAMQLENENAGRTVYEWKDDAGHEADAEERLVNRVATAYMGGREYARPWWRPRVVQFRNGVAPADLPDNPTMHPHDHHALVRYMSSPGADGAEAE